MAGPQTSSEKPEFDRGCFVCVLLVVLIFVLAECVFTVLVAGN